VTRARHASAAKRKPLRAKLIPIVAAALTAVAGSAAVAWPDGDTARTAVEQPPQETLSSAPQRDDRASRDQTASRPPVTVKPKPTTPPASKTPSKKPTTPSKTPSQTPVEAPEPTIVGTRYTTVSLNIRTGPAETFSVLSVLKVGSKVSITGENDGDWAQIVEDDKVRWVKAEFLSKEKPAEEDTGGISDAACPDGSDVEDGLRADTIRVHRAVCARFPGVSSYGGMRGGGGEHSVGRALDIMCSSSLGDDIADWVRDNATALGVSEVIWEQRIWTVERSSEGWRPMEDRGSPTANHYDHVHVTTYGDAGTS
jgi:hypothetical protein